MIINVSGDITLMDASDAAEFVQELAGEDANIIFGAMYDDSRTDEAVITVIATGLHNVNGTASKLKSRLENPRPAGAQSPYDNYDKQGGGIKPLGAQTHQQAPKLDLGMAPSRSGATTAVPRRTVAPQQQAPTLDAPKAPSPKVKEQSIKIPDFFKR